MSTLKIISRDGGVFNHFIEKASEKFRNLHNLPDFTVEVIEEEVHTLYMNMVNNKGMLDDNIDIMTTVTDWYPEIFEKKLATLLNPYIAKDPPEGWSDGWPQSLLQLQKSNNNIFGLPLHDGPEVLITRKDLFESQDNRNKFYNEYGYSLKPPTNWSEFLDIALFFNDPTNGMWGTITAGLPDAHNNVYDFLIQLWSRGGEFLNNSNKIAMFDNNIGEESLQFMVDLIHKYKVVPKESLKWDSLGSGIFFADGKAAMMWNWIGFASMAQKLDSSKVRGQVQCHLIPKSENLKDNISLNVYWAYSIPQGSKNKDLAYKFIKFLCSEEMDYLSTTFGMSGTRISTWNNPKLLESNPEYSIMEESHKGAKTLPKITEGTPIIEILNLMVDDAINLRTSPKEAISDAVQKINKILNK